MTVSKKIEITKIAKSRFSQVNFHQLQFGSIFSDHMLEAQFINGKWKSPKIKPFGTFKYHLAALFYIMVKNALKE